jgi:hypothetical protein
MDTPADPREPKSEQPPAGARAGAPPGASFLGMTEPEPFYKQPEGKRLIAFAILLVLVGLFALYVATTHKTAAPAQTAPGGDETVANEPVGSDPGAGEPVKAPAPPPLTPEERRKQFATMFEGGLLDTDNLDDFRETPGYRKMIDSVASIKPDEITRRAKRLDRDRALEDPDAWRGQFVRVRGVVGGLLANKLERPVYGITDVWRGTIANHDGTEAVVFDLVEPPPAFKVQDDLMDVEGVYYRTVRYQSRTNQWRTTPYLIARTLRPAPASAAQSQPVSTGSSMVIPAIGTFVLLSAWILYRFASHRRKEVPVVARRTLTFRELFERKLREEKSRSEPSKQ